MFLLVSVRHVGAHPDGHQHDVSIQISINLGKTFLRISRIRNILLTWILARVFVYLPPFIFQIPDFIYWTVLIFILIYFEWRDTKNQQFMLPFQTTPRISAVTYRTHIFSLLENMVIYGLQVASEITQFSSETSARNYSVILKRSQKTF